MLIRDRFRIDFYLPFAMSTCANGADISSIITLEVFVISILSVLILGGCIGYLIGKHYYLNSSSKARYYVGASLSPSDTEVKLIPTAQQPPSRTQSMSISSQSSTTSNSTDDEPTYDWDGNDLGNLQLSLLNTIARSSCNEEDGPTMVLRGSLDLMANKWGGEELGTNNKDTSVVEYLSPQQMTDLLFTKVTSKNDISETLCLDDCPDNNNICNEQQQQQEEVPSSPKSSTTDIINLLNSTNDKSTSSSTTLSPTQFLNLLNLIQKYSVNTSHPYFFNQLFGSLDPIALAADIVALSVNTSVYTYETAPVFTLLEREVMNQIGKLVFEHNGDRVEEEQQEEQFEGEGLMIPGGSLANLTAMHAARHRWKVMNGYTKEKQQQPPKEEEENSHLVYNYNKSTCPDMVAFISSEAHYSFSKSARVLGIREDDLIVIPTHSDGRMDVNMLAIKMKELEDEGEANQGSRKRVPFFVACTAGSTVRGSFDQVGEIVKVCREYESRHTTDSSPYERSIWVHVDGAWGGSAIFSSRPSLRSSTHMDEIRLADSFTFNPHKMLGAPQQTTAFIVRHRNAMRNASAAGAKYLFDPRKNGAEYDLGDLSYTCGRRTDAVKLWALWKYYGKSGLGQRVDQKVDELELFVEEVQRRESFALACKPWPFNVNFFYFPPRIRRILTERGILPIESWSSKEANAMDDYIQIPDDIAEDLSNVSVTLKLRLHEAGEMIIPYQVSDFGYRECILFCYC